MSENTSAKTGSPHVCSASHAGWLASSLRRLVHPPERMLRGLVREGDTAVDIGCGPGFFTLPLARLVGRDGRVIAVDLQEEMLGMMRRRAERAGLASRIVSHRCQAAAIGLDTPADFVLAFYMVHETPDIAAFLAELHGILKPGGKLLLAEPRFHVAKTDFKRTLELATGAGFRFVAAPRIWLSLAALFARD